MINKFFQGIVILTVLITSCKKSNQLANVDPRISAHYLFNPGTYWVYTDGANYKDSMYVAATGTRNGYPYMQISETIKNFNNDTLCSNFTTYIGAGPTATQLQQWGYDLINNTNNSQVIFDVDTPAYVGSYVGSGCIYAGSGAGLIPTSAVGVTQPSLLVSYLINYAEANQNQYYGQTSFDFYPGLGIAQKYSYNTPVGNLYGYLSNYHINH